MSKKLLVVVVLSLPVTIAVANDSGPPTENGSPYLRVQLASDQPAFLALSVDSLGKGKVGPNPLRRPGASGKKYTLNRAGNKVEYRVADANLAAKPVWSFEFATRQIHLHSSYSKDNPPPPLLLNFDPHINRATLLGLMNDDSSIRLPALLHLPDQGTLRITTNTANSPALAYDALRFPKGQRENDYVKITIPPAAASTPEVDYTLEVVEIHPGAPALAQDPRFDGFRRNWLNIFQLNPRRRALANHAASDVCAFTLFEYSSVAKRTPPLAPGLTALDLIRQTLDRYLNGMKAYGIVGYVPTESQTNPYDYTDTYPSLLMAAWDYVDGSKDTAWLHVNHALLGMASMARLVDRPEDAALYSSRTEKLRSAYFKAFYDPATGVLAGWRSADGQLHDYYFTFVNSVAITYGLIPSGKANAIMDRLLAKMAEVGYTHFEYGLPGNLIPIRRDDYLEARREWGGGEKDDGTDGFQIYENGGATACYAYFTLQALYQLGRKREGDAILFPMLRAFEEGGFQGGTANGRTKDWKAWDGTPYGYEGLLVDGYQTLLAVLSR